MTAKSPLGHHVDFEGIDDHLRECQQALMFEPERNIPDAKVIIIAASAFRDAADIR